MNHKYLMMISSLIVLILSINTPRAEIIRLKNGQCLQGKILSHDENGFVLERLDTGGVVELKWHHLPPAEAERIRLILNVKLSGEKLDGLKVFMKDGKVYIGLIVQEDETKFTLKILTGLVEINREQVLKTIAVTLDRFEVYTAEEIYLQERERLDLTQAADNYKLGEYCLETLHLYDKAKEHLKVAASDPSYQARAEEKLAQISGLFIRQKVSQVELALKNEDTQKARELVDELKQDQEFVQDQTALKIIKELEDKITKLEKEVISKRESETRKKVVAKWYKLIQEHLKKIAQNKQISYPDACQAVQTVLPRQINSEVATDLKLEEAEVDKIWSGRKLEESTKETVSYGEGSWLVAPPLKPPPASNVDEFVKYQEKMRRINQAKREAAQQRKLLTADAWWKAASVTQRTSWLRAFFAEKQMKVIKSETKPCPTCRGDGVLTRGESKFELCPRCQGTTVEVSITYY